MPAEARLPVTGLVLTFNGERWLPRTLSSLDFCRRLLVVDSGSTDRTLAIAEAHGAEILTRTWEGTIPQFRYAFGHIGAGWVVTLDQDEWLSPELKASLIAALASPGGAAGFWCSRRSFYFDRYLTHSGWYPDRLLRAFRLDAVSLGGTPPHEEFGTKGETRLLSGDIVHHPYAGFFEHVAKLNSYTQTAAEALHGQGRRASLAKAFLRGLSKFFKQYVLKQGFRDGRAGLILAVHGFFYAFEKYVRLLEMEETRGKSPGHDQP